MTFRIWLQQQWYTHCLEIEQWTGSSPTYSMQVYFQKNRWWLKRSYQHKHGAK